MLKIIFSKKYFGVTLVLSVVLISSCNLINQRNASEYKSQRDLIQSYCGKWKYHNNLVPDSKKQPIITTSLLELSRLDVDIPIPIYGGGIDSCGSNLVILSGVAGKLYHMDMATGNLRELDIALPENGRKALETYARSVGKKVKTQYWHRYNDIAYWVGESNSLYLLLSYSFWDSEKKCFTSRLAKTQITEALDISSQKEVDWIQLFETQPCVSLSDKGHAYAGHEAGGRIYALNEKEIVLTVGDYALNGIRSLPNYAQIWGVSYGKTYKINIEKGSAKIFSIGHRNHQGVTVDDQNNIWSVEHGPQGGDELNLLKEGENYGWPYVTYGTDYNSFEWPFNGKQGKHEGYKKPVYAWVPSVGASNLDVIRDFSELWDQDLLVASLTGRTLYRMRMDDHRIVFAEPIRLDTKIRYVHSMGNKTIVALTNGHKPRLIILRPIEKLLQQTPNQYLVNLNQENSDIELDRDENVRIAFNQCIECHNNQTGSAAPSLKGVFGREVGASNYKGYSKAFLGADFYWNEENLFKFLSNPNSLVNGTLMPNPGITDKETIAGLVEILKSY